MFVKYTSRSDFRFEREKRQNGFCQNFFQLHLVYVYMGAKKSKPKLSPQTLNDLKKDVEFTSEEIKSWYKEYRHSLRSGKKELTKEEFKNVYNSVFPGDASDFAEHVFRTFDVDGNGTVDFKEFLVGLSMSGSTDLQAKLKWAFTVYDIDGNGHIDRDELRHIVSTIYKMTGADITEDLGTPDQVTDKLFTQFDSNNDGRISYEEFCQGASRDPLILHLLQCSPN